jgi:hypothetical protein
MSDANVAVAAGETRQAMIRVWMAISAIWIAFWLAIAALVMMTGEIADPLASQFQLFALIVMLPPIVLLTIGAMARWTFEAVFRHKPARTSPRSPVSRSDA